jgi:hypothetical protein
MKLYATLLGKENGALWENALTSSDLFPEHGAVREVTIVSAYIDLKMLKTICRKSFKEADGRTGG